MAENNVKATVAVAVIGAVATISDDDIMAQKYRELLNTSSPQRGGMVPRAGSAPPSSPGSFSRDSDISIDSFVYHQPKMFRGPYWPMVRERFDWTVTELPEGPCTFQIVAGTSVIAQGKQNGSTGRAEASYKAEWE